MYSIIIPTFNNLEYLKLVSKVLKIIQNLKLMKLFHMLMMEVMVHGLLE